MNLFEKIGEVIRFGIVGVSATIIHYTIYLLLLNFISNCGEGVSYTIGYLISFFVNFYLSNVYVFRTKPTVKKGAGFALSHLINYLLHLAFLELSLWIGIPANYAPIPVFCFVVPINFLLIRFVLKR